MPQDFVSWLTNINESTVPGLSSIAPKVGDMVFFGIHLLSNYNREHNSFPQLSVVPGQDVIDVSKLVTPIVDVDPVDHAVLVMPGKSMHALGYRGADFRNTDNQKRVKLPANQLQNVSSLFSDASGFRNSKDIWMPYGNYSHQKGLMRKLRKLELMQSQNQQSPQPSTQPELTDDDRVRALMGVGVQQPRVAQTQPSDLTSMFKPEQKPRNGLVDFMNQRRMMNLNPTESVETKKHWKYY